jgi:hypothetical protein
MWGSEPLMIVSTTDIPVLHYAEVVSFTQKSCYLFAWGVCILKHFQGELARVHYEAITKFH